MNANSWLLEIVRREKLRGMEQLPAELPGGTEEAWNTVCLACHLEPRALAEVVGKHLGMPYRANAVPTPAVLRLLPESLAKGLGVLPIGREEDALLLAIGRPPERELVDRLHFATDLEPRFSIHPPAVIALTTIAAYESLARPDGALKVDSREDALNVGTLAAQTARGPEDPGGGPVVRLANLMLSEAVRLRASDIHLQPIHNSGNLRFRIDGRLRRVAFLPKSVTRRVIGRIKAVSGMDPTDSIHAQDGSVRISGGDAVYDLRVSTLPVEGGEKLVVRFLPQSRIQGLDAMGIAEPELSQFKALIERGSGLVLVTGPTGCGKTTTLHSALADQNRTDVSIATVEDPVEYRVPRLAQIQVNPDAGLTFATALRSVLRQDPDVVLVGEIRDAETAQIASQAALTGHLVLSTLHTLDAASAVPRLLDLDVLPSFLAESLSGVVAQRLVRKLCADCSQAAQAPFTENETWLMQHAGVKRPMRAVGCVNCGFTGFRGRILVMQVLSVTPECRQLIADGAKLDALRATAGAHGMRTLAESALDRIRAGATTVEEAAWELGNEFWDALGVRRVLAVGPADDFDARPKVLLVEHDARMRATLRADLERHDMRVEEAEHSGIARERIERSADFSAIVIDLEGMVTERVKRLMELRDSLAGAATPVIALTDEKSAALDEGVKAHGSVSLLRKPVDGALIVAELRRWLGEAA